MDSPTVSPLVKRLGLLNHPEGGYFLETDRRVEETPSPFAGKPLKAEEYLADVLSTLYAGGIPRPLATSIYYLLTYDRPSGVIHMNKSVTYHVLHQGRVEYTLITPGTPPIIEKKVMGTGPNELRQLVVGTGIWKMSRILPEDLMQVKTDEDKRNLGCLITEVVVPGFDWEDHRYLTRKELVDLLNGIPNRESLIAELEVHLKADG